MVTHLDCICLEVHAAREQPAFTCFAGVAHEEFSECSRVEHDDDAVLVHVVPGIGEERQRWR
jgi:hypothetical protein